jgi:hypothetical protein
MASMHGSYRRVNETAPAVLLIGEVMAKWNSTGCHWLVDQPVSNSARLKKLLHEAAAEHGWNWTAELVPNPDAVLLGTSEIAATADSQILDHVQSWFNLARRIIDMRIQAAWIVDLSG